MRSEVTWQKITMVNKRPVGRPRARGDARDITWPVKLSENVLEQLKQRKERDGIPVATQIFRSVEKDLGADDEPVRPYIPMLGDIPAGPATEVHQATPGMFIRPPYDDLPEDCYALAVNGNSMESEFGITVKNGFYALFAPGVIFPHAIVHVEFSDGEFQHKATLKKYVPKGNGTTEFRPLNKSHKPIIVRDEVFVIKGGFIKAWDGVSGLEDDKAK